MIEQGKQIASHVLEASAADIEFAHGRFVIAGTDRAIGIMELAEKLRAGLKLPRRTCRSRSTSATSATARRRPSRTAAMSPRSRSIPTPASIEVVNYTSVNDFGTVINPMLVEGQMHGGVVQGIGQALMERRVYDDDGPAADRLVHGLRDAARARRARLRASISHPVPATTNPLGVKGCGEAGCAGSLTSVMNAVVDALSDYGIRHIDMPATPYRVWRAIQDARAHSGDRPALRPQ